MRKARYFISALLIAAMPASLLSCSKKDEQPKYSKQLDTSVREEIHKNAAESDLLTGDKLENGEIKWLSDWDINPDSTGKNVPTDLAVFQERYGGTVKYYKCTYENRYDKLAEYINSDEGIDFFYGGNLDAFPNGAIKKIFAPVDDYIDFDSPLWEDVKDLNDSFILNGKQYMAGVQATGDKVGVIYNKKTVAEAGLEDPADLYAKGKWDWDAFENMLEQYVDPSKQRYGIDGWWFEFGLMNTIGIPPVSLEEGRLISNIGDPSMERVQNWMYELSQKGYIAIGSEDLGWEARPAYIGEGGYKAAKMHHNVIMTPNDVLYFDYYQTLDTDSEPEAGGGSPQALKPICSSAAVQIRRAWQNISTARDSLILTRIQKLSPINSSPKTTAGPRICST